MSDMITGAEQIRSLVEAITDYAIFMLDLEGYITSWNPGASRIKGYSAEEAIGKHFSCFYLPEDVRSGKPERELEIAKESGRYQEEGQRVRKNGEVFWALVVISPVRDQSGRLCGFAKVTRDISDQKSAEEKMRMMVLWSLNAMIVVNDQGAMVLVNPQAEKLFGYDDRELNGQCVDILLPPEIRATHATQRANFFAHPAERSMGAGRDLYGRRKDGTLFPVEIGLRPMQSSRGMLVLGSILDISERKRIEEVNRQRLAELAHAARLSSMGEMFSGFAHEISQPLAAAANFARACVRNVKANSTTTKEQLLEWMEKAAAQSERASQIVKCLSTFMKKDHSLRTKLNINVIVEGVLEIMSLLTSCNGDQRQTTIRVELENQPSWIHADRIQIEQVLINLVRNSVEALYDVPVSHRLLLISTRTVGQFVQVSVKDNGHGITPKNQEMLFSPFFTTKAEGMGLGLSISRSIIESHDGRMTVELIPGQETTFSFLLPLLGEDGSP